MNPTRLVAFALCFALAAPALAQHIEPEARLHLDYASHQSDTRPLENDLIVRRADLGLEGDFGENWSFEIGYELADDGRIRLRDGGFKDVSVTWQGWSAGDLSVGQFKIPFGLEESTSSNALSFMERALPVDAFAPSRRMGVGFSRKQDAYTVSTMVFGSSIDGDDRGRGAGARVTVAPLHGDASVVHLGAAAVIEDPRSKVDFDVTPESRVADVDLVNTGRIEHVERIRRVGLEGAWRTGPVSVQAEWMRVDLARDAGWTDASLGGWYVQGSWVLTGEARPYKNGEFKDIRPDSSAGAWELVLRYSRINLDDGWLEGGRQHDLGVGLNYYLNKHLRIMLNYIQVHSVRRGVADNPDIAQLRVQIVL